MSIGSGNLISPNLWVKWAIDLLGGNMTIKYNALAAVAAYGEHLGLAFQIVDDILDVVGDVQTLGKNPGSDAAQGKVTYPTLLGLDESRRLAEEASAAGTSERQLRHA